MKEQPEASRGYNVKTCDHVVKCADGPIWQARSSAGEKNEDNGAEGGEHLQT